jgi:hypothetical protein
MSYSMHVARNAETGQFEVLHTSGDVPEGHFTISGHHQPGFSDEISVSHHTPGSGNVTVRSGGYAGHAHAIAHHAAKPAPVEEAPVNVAAEDDGELEDSATFDDEEL